MIKRIAPAQHHPTNRTLAEFCNYWAETHGPLFANTKKLRRYVQHLTLPESYGVEPAPTFDGCSMFWYDDLASQFRLADTPEAIALFEAVVEDDRQLFDRATEWPTHHRRAHVVAEERIIVEGPTTQEMVKAIFIVSKLPGLTPEEFFDHWQNDHGSLCAGVPGLRRYVQNHAIPEALPDRRHTHDGWSELWFDDLAALHSAVKSPEWQAVRDDGTTLFAYPMGVGVARERIQKEFDWTYNDFGVNAMTEEDVRSRLADQGFVTLAADADAPRQIKAAAEGQALAVWTWEHIVTIDASRIDARPER